MKKGLLFIPAVALLAGCASNAEYYAAMVEINAKRAEVEAVKADSQSQRINALVQMAEQGDETTKASATMALALMNSNNGDEKDSTTVTPEAPRSQVLDWASVLLPFTGQVVTGYMNYNLGKVQSNNSVRLSESEHEAFTELGIGAYREGNAPRYRPDDSYDLGEGRIKMQEITQPQE
jgi:hypothetical protein